MDFLVNRQFTVHIFPHASQKKLDLLHTDPQLSYVNCVVTCLLLTQYRLDLELSAQAAASF